jgi:hypothetical protein
MNDPWCSLAWNHHFIGPGGNCKPCCRFKGQNVPPDNNLKTSDLDSLFNNNFMNDIRLKMLQGIRVPGCDKCYEEEDANKRASLRQIYNRLDRLTNDIDPEEPKIIFLESSFSNICDLQCVMCGPYFSIAWNKQDRTDIEDLVPPFDRLGIDIESIKSIIPNLKHMKFTGGEPLLIPEYKMILEERAKHKDFNSCFLNYSTNLMHFPDSRLLDLWKKVEYVEIATSFDGIGKVIEYVRYPSKWPVVERNLIKFMELSRLMDIRVGMRSTIMPYNVLDLPNMINWWSEKINKHYRYPFNEFSWINPTHVAQPVFLTLKVLPKNCKDIVRDRIWDKGLNKKVNQSFNHLCNYMDSEDHSHFLDDFRRFTNKMDQRGIKFKDIYPELANEIF